ncbi:MAG: lipid-A-disaccharide synthase [Leptolyngbyaceae cyanobacterium]
MSLSMSDRDDSPPSLHLFISTGEVSGDLQGSYLAQALFRQAQQRGIPLKISGLGGKRMATAGAQIVGDTTPIGAVGILEAIPYWLPNLRIQRQARRFFRQVDIDLIIFLDYMGPNLSLGKFLVRAFPHLPTTYYIAPQQWVWAYSENDTQWLVRMADRMVAVFPQEAEYYRRFGADVSYFGHPLIDQFEQPASRTEARQQLEISPNATVITLLPASRQQELVHVLPLILQAAQKIQATIPEVQFLLPVSMPKLRSSIAQAIARMSLPAQIIDTGSATAIAAADLVLNKSGTVNLEVALMNVPQVVIYRLNPITARVAYYLLQIQLPFISPVNLFVNKPIVPELIQWEATPEAIAQTSLALLQDEQARAAVQAGYAEMRSLMGEPGVCDRAAAHLLDFALQRKQVAGSAASHPTG